MSSAFVVFVYVVTKGSSDTSLVVNFIWNEPACTDQNFVSLWHLSFPYQFGFFSLDCRV